MKRVGEVIRTAQGLAIARCPEGSEPEIGTVGLTEREALERWHAGA